MNRSYINFFLILLTLLNVYVHATCPDGWKVENITDNFYAYKCYKAFNQTVDFYTAESFCKNHSDGNLISIQSASENTHIFSYGNDTLKNQTSWWIGGYSFDVAHADSYWRWTDFLVFTNLYVGVIGNVACHGCCLIMDSTSQLWKIQNCTDDKHPFICEILLPANSSTNALDYDDGYYSNDQSTSFGTFIIFGILIVFTILIIVVASCHPNCKSQELTQKILIEARSKKSRIYVIFNKILFFKKVTEKEIISVSDCTSETNFSIENERSISFHFDANMDIEATNSELSIELMKLKKDGNVNKLTFPDDNKIYLFNFNDLECLGTLGVSNFRQVRKYLHKPSDIKMAIKFLTIPQGRYDGNNSLKAVLREIQNMRMLSESSTIVTFYGLCMHEEHALLCMELMDLSLRDLYHMIHKEKEQDFPERLVGYIFVKMVDSLNFCKFKGVIHRDVKPCNILVKYSGEIKLCDFGESRILDNSLASTHVGTIAYWPPERFDYTYTKYDIRSDVWSLGITLMEVILGRLPYLQHEHDVNKDENDVHKMILPQYIIKTNYVGVVERYIKPKYSHILCETLELCTRKLEERPKLKYLESTEFYQQFKSIEQVEIAKILQFERLI